MEAGLILSVKVLDIVPVIKKLLYEVWYCKTGTWKILFVSLLIQSCEIGKFGVALIMLELYKKQIIYL